MPDLQDGATICTNGSNFGAVINENWLYDAGQGIYFDEGSDGLSATHNVLTPEGEAATAQSHALTTTNMLGRSAGAGVLIVRRESTTGNAPSTVISVMR